MQKPKKRKTNWYMTTGCKHGAREICDFCLLAYADHRGLTTKRKRIFSHRFAKRDGGDRFVCASCKG